MKLEYSELTVLMTRIIPMEKDPKEFDGAREQWEQKQLNSVIKKLESEATRLRNLERSK